LEAEMKCIACGHQTQEQVEDRELQLGLPYHVVAKDSPVHVCVECGARYAGFKAPASTLRSLATWVVQRPGRLHGTEIRFIRNSRGWSQEQLGRRLGVAAETISRWENSKKPVGYQSELALRFLVLAGNEVADQLDSDAGPPARVEFMDDMVIKAVG
jgi:DNA-binding transcriptional regulator YiaG